MSDYTESDKIEYWKTKYIEEFDRAKAYEMDLIHANYLIRNLQAEVNQLEFDLRLLMSEKEVIRNENEH